MADDSLTQTVQDIQTSTTQPEDTSSSPQSQDQQLSTPVVTDDQSAGSNLIRPVSTIPADSVPVDTSANQLIPDSSPSIQDLPVEPQVAAEQEISAPVIPQVQEDSSRQAESKVQPLLSVEPAATTPPENPDTVPDQSAEPDSNRPVSTIPADSVIDESKPEIPVETKPVDLSANLPAEALAQVGALAKEDSVSEVQQPEIPVEIKPADLQTDSTIPVDPINENQVPVQPEQSSLQPNSDTGQNTGTPQIQAEQGQSETPKVVSSSDIENSGNDPAGIQPEPPDSPQIAATEEVISEKTDNLSFGDLLSGQSVPGISSTLDQLPVSETPKPSVSFGDLIDDLKPKDISYDTVIPPISSSSSIIPDPVSNTTQPVSVSPQPSSNPINPPNTPTAQTSQTSPDPIIIEKPVEVIKEVVKEIPVEKIVEKVIEVTVVDEIEVNKRTDERLSQEVDIRLQKATQKRIEKREENLNKVLQFLQSKPKANNSDIRDYLRVSQTTATEYLHTLVTSGKIRMEGKGKATIYHL